MYNFVYINFVYLDEAETHMTTMMIRKQIYIPRRQDILIKRLSQSRGVSEAEVIRQAIENEISGSSPRQPFRDSGVWEELMQSVEEVRQEWGGKREPIRWTREELYAEREDRWLNNREGM